LTAILETSEFTRRFGGLVAVDAVSMSVAPGEIRGLIGPNGAGKTTMLNLIGGFMKPSAGHITLEGADVTGLRSDRLASLGIRRTFQNLKLFADLTVLQNVLIGAHTDARSGVFDAIVGTGRHRREEQQMAAAGMAALATVGLQEQAHASAGLLAYGHRRLLEIARAIVAKPKVLLLDEPAAGLNPTEALQLVELIRKINAGGVTVVLVEHHMDVIMSVCSRITVLNYGKKLAEGSPDEIRGNEQVIEAYLGRAGLEERLAAYA
jgi:branched-chain amino acid transport system ATP-binding protein